jgi:16S rRNA U1498 N3-methylase RsmE
VRVGPSSCTAEAAAVRAAAVPPTTVPALVLMQCLPKGRKMDLIIRQAVEAGVKRIVPLVSDHAVVRPDEGSARLERWRCIAREVALLESSGFRRAWLGDGLLCTETAALYALAAVRTIMRERETWRPSREG